MTKKEITLREHLSKAGKLGGKARMDQLTPEERSDLASIAGEAGGKARAGKLTAKRRSEIAKKGAKARWGKR